MAGMILGGIGGTGFPVLYATPDTVVEAGRLLAMSGKTDEVERFAAIT